MPTDNLTETLESAAKPFAAKCFRRFLGSVGCLIVVFLLLFELGICVLKPLTMLNATGLTTRNQYYVVSNLPEFLNFGSSPKVILTGPSLFLQPSVRCDDRLRGRCTRYDSHYIRDAHFFMLMVVTSSLGR